MVAKLWASEAKRNKGKAKPLTSKVADSVGEDLSYLPLAITVLGLTFSNMPLETDAKVPLEPIRSLRHRAL